MCRARGVTATKWLQAEYSLLVTTPRQTAGERYDMKFGRVFSSSSSQIRPVHFWIVNLFCAFFSRIYKKSCVSLKRRRRILLHSTSRARQCKIHGVLGEALSSSLWRRPTMQSVSTGGDLSQKKKGKGKKNARSILDWGALASLRSLFNSQLSSQEIDWAAGMIRPLRENKSGCLVLHNGDTGQLLSTRRIEGQLCPTRSRGDGCNSRCARS